MKSRNIPPTYLGISMMYIVLVSYFIPGYSYIDAPYNWLGAILIILGIIIVLGTRISFKKTGTTHKYEKSTAVIKDGLYRFSRNPMYFGMLLALLGIAVCFNHMFGLLAPLFFFGVINFKFIPYEEKKMEEELGQDYLDYKKSVRRWL